MDKMMNFNETKRYLKISRATLYRWASEGTIPAIKMGGVWRFKKEKIDRWLDSQENIKRKK
jgi:excisionase family DNA binding protein